MAFRTWYGYFEDQILLFGLSNISASFWGYINKILDEMLNVFVIVYFDNILIYTGETDYDDVFWWVLDLFRKHFLYSNSKKYCFHQKEVQFFNHVIFLQKICIKDKRIEAICDCSKH